MIHYQIAGENEKAPVPDSFSPVLFTQIRKKGIIINYYIRIEQQNIPVSEEIYKIWQHGERKERYFREGDIRNGVFSYDALDGEGLNGSELFADEDRNPVEHQAERDLLINVLKQALNTLNNEDKELLALIYCQEESLRSIAQSTGVPFTTLQYRHKKVIKKLKLYYCDNTVTHQHVEFTIYQLFIRRQNHAEERTMYNVRSSLTDLLKQTWPLALVIKRDANIAADASHVFMATRLARSVFSLP